MISLYVRHLAYGEMPVVSSRSKCTWKEVRLDKLTRHIMVRSADETYRFFPSNLSFKAPTVQSCCRLILEAAIKLVPEGPLPGYQVTVLISSEQFYGSTVETTCSISYGPEQGLEHETETWPAKLDQKFIDELKLRELVDSVHAV